MEAPFNDDQIDKLNQFQSKGFFHPFTCGCGFGLDAEQKSKCERLNGTGEGVLIATKDGWICPCGEYTQKWTHNFMGT